MDNLRLRASIGLVCAGSVAAWAAEVTFPTAATEILVKQTDPARVVYLEHTGPYWTVGPLFKQVRQVMADHNENGPMFARYLTDPTVAPAESLRTEVGFVTQGTWEPEPPFKTAQRDGEQVVSTLVDGAYGTTVRIHSQIRSWVLTNGFETVGPVIELYASPPQGAPPGVSRTEIQIPVRRASWGVRATREQKATVVVPRKPDEALAMAEDERPAAAESLELRYSIKDLVDSWKFDRVAEQLIPLERPMPVGMQVWLGQVVFRISAVAKGIEQTQPGGSPQVTALSEAIVRRYRHASTSSKVDPLAQAVVRVDARLDPQSTQKQSIVRDLDNLLGQVALKTVDAESALDRLSSLLQRVQDTTNAAPIRSKQ